MTCKLTDEYVLVRTRFGWTRKIHLADIERVTLESEGRRARLVLHLADGISKTALPGMEPAEAEAMAQQLQTIVDPPDAKATEALSLEEIRRRLAGLSAAAGVRAGHLARLLFDQALRLGASDVHLEGAQTGSRVLFRIDGVLHEVGTIASGPAERVLAHLKVASGVASYRRDIPQEGRMLVSPSDAQSVEVRLSFMPVGDGEKAVGRLSDARRTLALGALGFSPHLETGLLRLLSRRQGMILLTGPSASGKTTTIYASVQHLVKGPRAGAHVVTIEDPVECRFPGVTQVQVDLRRDMTFPKLLGNLLRQDAEVIVVGEIRDHDTASIAVQASLTGQLLLSTLHAGRAPEVVVRLLDLGIEPYRVASSLAGALSQRLVRAICETCRERDRPADALLKEYEKWLPGQVVFQRGAGCAHCFGTGYRGRLVVGELLTLDESWGDLLRGHVTSAEVMAASLQAGMVPLVQDAVAKVCEGRTTLEEIKRVLG